MLEEFSIELNKESSIEDIYYVAEDIVTEEGWIIKQIKIENSNTNGKVTIEVDNYLGTEEELISEKVKNINRFLIRIYDKDNNLVDEKNEFWWGDILVTDKFNSNEEYSISGYYEPFLHIIDEKGKTIKIIDSFGDNFKGSGDIYLRNNKELVINCSINAEEIRAVVNLKDYSITYESIEE